MAIQKTYSSQKEIAEIWKLFRETDRKMQETTQQMKEMSQETDRKMQEMSKEADRRMKKTDRQIQKIGGRFNQRWGAFVESLVEGSLVKIFQDIGIDITQTHSRSQSEWRKSKDDVERREFDIIVANGTEVVVVEVKTTLVQKDVDVFLNTLKDFRKYFPRYRTETIYGAVAYLTSENKAHVYAEEEGLFLIQATGDSAILANQKNFQPKKFS